MNKIILTGRLTRDIELKKNGDSTYAHFTIAQDEGYGDYKKTLFIDCAAFGKTAENLAKFCGKGSSIAIDGRLDISTYEREGKKMKTWKVLAERVEFISTKKKDADGFEQVDEEMPF